MTRPTESIGPAENEPSNVPGLKAEHRLRSLIEAAIFASPEPVTIRQLARSLNESDDTVQRLIEETTAELDKSQHGVCIRKAGGGYQMGTKPEHHQSLKEVLRGLRPRAPLSLPALQTLAIIAYRQPISAPEIQAIRRVEGAGVLDTLLKRKLIAAAGRRQEAGHALLYKTTSLFLADFGLESLKNLPALEEFAEPHKQNASQSSEP